MTLDLFMDAAIQEAQRGLAAGGIPIGSVVVKNGTIVGRGHNLRVQQGSAILHAEMSALETLGRQPAMFYQDVTLYTTLSPCSMCTGAILLYKIPRVVIGENHTFMGEEALLKSRGVKVTVLDLPQCRQMMQAFIKGTPQLWYEDIGVEQA
ncbi:nucleoside deaminase [Acaryochloris marina]|uniref:Cytosine/adenosine deaminase n=1 Tax=Acaryochloris marina (strain MBIC 11017) TaxID=329726 RepID=B0BZQ8_ACAM1|nr:nucleoside deaminase [Acaryochloris marina]ABW25984.1 Cytosine/adenosine deaminase [Acaryochloris marina MBIC11017]BDM80833.1 tRNA-specific adenosine deaminase [Acaryochloris marina MBIC10699]